MTDQEKTEKALPAVANQLESRASRDATYCLVTLRRGRKRALLLAPNGALFTDLDDRDAAIKAQFALGWKTADVAFFYPGDKHGGDVILAPTRGTR